MLNGSGKDFRVALFGPQITAWTIDSLSSLRVTLANSPNLDFIKQALQSISSIWALIERDFGSENPLTARKLEKLESFFRGAEPPDPWHLTNTELAPLTVVSQIVEFIDKIDPEVPYQSLNDFSAAQGFCIGFLSAAALSSASDWTELKINISNSIRLAACIGIVVDTQESTLGAQDRISAVSVRWKKAADREVLESYLERSPLVSS